MRERSIAEADEMQTETERASELRRGECEKRELDLMRFIVIFSSGTPKHAQRLVRLNAQNYLSWKPVFFRHHMRTHRHASCSRTHLAPSAKESRGECEKQETDLHFMKAAAPTHAQMRENGTKTDALKYSLVPFSELPGALSALR